MMYIPYTKKEKRKGNKKMDKTIKKTDLKVGYVELKKGKMSKKSNGDIK